MAEARDRIAAPTVLVCTKNRCADLQRLLDSLVRDDVDVIVVDQSDDSVSADMISARFADGCVRYVRSTTRGKGAAMNEGLQLARTAIVVCTDDDCEAPAGWARSMTSILAKNPEASLLFCRVEAPAYDQSLGFVPQYRPRRDRAIRHTLASCLHRGLGAGMALRREVIAALDGVDESFGPGARFGSGDDWNTQIRMLMTGWVTLETDQVSIIHHGFRTFAEGRVHAVRDWKSLGGAAAMPVRAGHPLLALMGAYVLVVDAMMPMVRDVLHLKRPRGAARVVAFGRGFVAGMLTPVDRKTLKYRARPGTI